MTRPMCRRKAGGFIAWLWCGAMVLLTLCAAADNFTVLNLLGNVTAASTAPDVELLSIALGVEAALHSYTFSDASNTLKTVQSPDAQSNTVENQVAWGLTQANVYGVLGPSTDAGIATVMDTSGFRASNMVCFTPVTEGDAVRVWNQQLYFTTVDPQAEVLAMLAYLNTQRAVYTLGLYYVEGTAVGVQQQQLVQQYWDGSIYVYKDSTSGDAKATTIDTDSGGQETTATASISTMAKCGAVLIFGVAGAKATSFFESLIQESAVVTNAVPILAPHSLLYSLTASYRAASSGSVVAAENILFTSSQPPLTERPRYPSVAAFEEALTSFTATVALNSQLNATDSLVKALAYRGYIAGRIVAQALDTYQSGASTTSLTDFQAALFNTASYTIDTGLNFGQYTSSCNQGGREVFLLGLVRSENEVVVGGTALPIPLVDNAPFAFRYPESQCYVGDTTPPSFLARFRGLLVPDGTDMTTPNEVQDYVFGQFFEQDVSALLTTTTTVKGKLLSRKALEVLYLRSANPLPLTDLSKDLGSGTYVISGPFPYNDGLDQYFVLDPIRYMAALHLKLGMLLYLTATLEQELVVMCKALKSKPDAFSISGRSTILGKQKFGKTVPSTSASGRDLRWIQQGGTDEKSKIYVFVRSVDTEHSHQIISVIMQALQKESLRMNRYVVVGETESFRLESNGFNFVIGLRGADVSGVVNFLKTNTGASVFVAMDDLTANYAKFSAAFGTTATPASKRLFFATNLPLWTSTAYSAAPSPQTVSNFLKDNTNYQSPAAMRGYVAMRVMQDVMAGLGIENPLSVAVSEYLYQKQTITVDSLQFGSYNLARLINYGAKSISVWAYQSVQSVVEPLQTETLTPEDIPDPKELPNDDVYAYKLLNLLGDITSTTDTDPDLEAYSLVLGVQVAISSYPFKVGTSLELLQSPNYATETIAEQVTWGLSQDTVYEVVGPNSDALLEEVLETTGFAESSLVCFATRTYGAGVRQWNPHVYFTTVDPHTELVALVGYLNTQQAVYTVGYYGDYLTPAGDAQLKLLKSIWDTSIYAYTFNGGTPQAVYIEGALEGGTTSSADATVSAMALCKAVILMGGKQSTDATEFFSKLIVHPTALREGIYILAPHSLLYALTAVYRTVEANLSSVLPPENILFTSTQPSLTETGFSSITAFEASYTKFLENVTVNTKLDTTDTLVKTMAYRGYMAGTVLSMAVDLYNSAAETSSVEDFHKFLFRQRLYSIDTGIQLGFYTSSCNQGGREVHLMGLKKLDGEIVVSEATLAIPLADHTSYTYRYPYTDCYVNTERSPPVNYPRVRGLLLPDGTYAATPIEVGNYVFGQFFQEEVSQLSNTTPSAKGKFFSRQQMEVIYVRSAVNISVEALLKYVGRGFVSVAGPYPYEEATDTTLVLEPVRYSSGLRIVNAAVMYLSTTLEQEIVVLCRSLRRTPTAFSLPKSYAEGSSTGGKIKNTNKQGGTDQTSRIYVFIRSAPEDYQRIVSVIMQALEDQALKMNEHKAVKPEDPLKLQQKGLNLVIGARGSDVAAIAYFLKENAEASVFVAMDDLTANYDKFSAAFGTTATPASKRLFFATNLPLWTSTAYSAAPSPQTVSNFLKDNTNYQSPAAMRGYVAMRVMQQAVEGLKDSNPLPGALMGYLYAIQRFQVDKLTFGTYSEHRITNFGAQRISVWPYESLLDSSAKPLNTITISPDEIPVPHKLPKYQFLMPLWAIILLSCLAALLVIVLIVWLLYCYCPALLCCDAGRNTASCSQGSWRHVTIVFTDIAALGLLSVQLGPLVMSDVTTAYQKILRRLIQRYKMCEVKHSEDGGAFMIVTSNPHNAILFGAELQCALQRHFFGAAVKGMREVYEGANQTAKEVDSARGWSGLRVRVGMHTGLAQSRFYGVAERYDYTGRVPYLAAATASLARGGEVLFTDETYLALTQAERNQLKQVEHLGKHYLPLPEHVIHKELSRRRHRSTAMNSATTLRSRRGPTGHHYNTEDFVYRLNPIAHRHFPELVSSPAVAHQPSPWKIPVRSNSSSAEGTVGSDSLEKERHLSFLVLVDGMEEAAEFSAVPHSRAGEARLAVSAPHSSSVRLEPVDHLDAVLYQVAPLSLFDVEFLERACHNARVATPSRAAFPSDATYGAALQSLLLEQRANSASLRRSSACPLV